MNAIKEKNTMAISDGVVDSSGWFDMKWHGPDELREGH